MNKLLNLVSYILILLLTISLISCSSGGDGGTGTLGIGLTDTPGDYDHVFVTIKEVQVKKGLNNGESGWLTGFEVNETFDLLELQNGAIADLGLTELEAGKYNQLRLILSSEPLGEHPFANYVVIQVNLTSSVSRKSAASANLVRPNSVSRGFSDTLLRIKWLRARQIA